MIEYFFICPYCWQEISMLLDPDMSKEEYVEDCQVCCNPISVRFEIDDDRVIKFEVIKLQ
jgi:hypothetical protein